MSEHSLQADLEQALATPGVHAYGSPHAAGTRLIARILDWASRESTKTSLLDDATKQRIKAVALAAFDAFDIPYIGGIVESAVKSALRPVLENLLDQVLRIGL